LSLDGRIDTGEQGLQTKANAPHIFFGIRQWHR
jgi:hypothetical protein